ncbi:MAG: hypothetical protein GXO70_00600 [Acidobacteria bacterium]|nr:hypothetical protein [Acidobacteriota bacterium]
MNKLVPVKCPKCGEIFEIPYILIGAQQCCCSCGEKVVCDILVGTLYPETGFEMTFADFQQLLAGKDTRRLMSTLLRDWYSYEIEEQDDTVCVRSMAHENVDLLKVHLRIQADPEKRKRVYEMAMSNWR